MQLLSNGPPAARTRVLLAHGAGAPMDSPFMETMATLLAERGLGVLRFEFTYMAARRAGGRKRPAPKAETLMPEFVIAAGAARDGLGDGGRLVIGGKSMGGRVASLIADQLAAEGQVAGLVCLGYPFRPPARPEQLRTSHLAAIRTPTLIVQGERDPFGGRTDVEGWQRDGTIAPAIRLHWAGDGDHDLGPRGASGHTRKGNLTAAADAIADFVAELST